MSNPTLTSNAKKMREAIAKRQQEQAQREEAAPVVPPPAPAPAKKPKPIPPGPKLKHACGHEVGLKQYEQRECEQCRNKKRQEHNQRRMDQRLPVEKAPEERGRLPDGSEFQAVYDAGTKRWKGSLYFGPVDERVILSDDSGAVMKLLKKLDAQYRAWLEAQTTTREGTK